MSKCTECGEEGHPWWDHELPKGFKFGEEPLEPYKDWQLDNFGDGIEITSRAQRRKIMSQHGLDYHKNRAGDAPGRIHFDMGRMK